MHHAMNRLTTNALPAFCSAMLALSAMASAHAMPAQAAAPAAPSAKPDEAAPPTAAEIEAARRKAAETFDAIIKAYRDPRGVSAQIEVVVGAGSAAGDGAAPAVACKGVFGSARRALIGLRGYQLRIAGGRIVATHDSNPLAYLDVSDHGSPYYALFNAFQSLPIPELALALGEDAPEEICMQLMPQIPDVLPARVVDEEVDGQVYRVLVLESDDLSQSLKLHFDPETHLVELAVGTRKAGAEVEPGASLTWTVKSRVERPAQAPDDATFAFDPTGKQKVDGLAALVVRDRGAAEDRDVEALKAGEPAPTLALPRLGGGDWDLVAARPRPVVLDFWATWCGPCVAALPSLAKLAAEFKGKVDVVLVNSGEQAPREEREATIRKVFEGRKVKVGADADLACVLDLDGQAARRWLVRAFPTTFVVAPDGRLAGVWVGNSPRNEREIHAKLVELCGGAPAGAAVPEAAPAKDAAPVKDVAPAPGAAADESVPGKPGRS